MNKPITIDQTHIEYCVECIHCEEGLVSSNNRDRVVELANSLGFTTDDTGCPVCADCRKEREQ